MNTKSLQDTLCLSPLSPLQGLVPLIQKLSLKPYTILICGESGTGKEILAKEIHNNCLFQRQHLQQMIPLNCGALNPSTLESELFGHQKGAFTGALSDYEGAVRGAHQSTLFLDEIGELPLEAQTRLLRVLQEKTVRPLGSNKSIKVDFRLICATHRNLEEQIQKGLFREDLFYRINLFKIELLPLRKRRKDIPYIAKKIWKQLSSPEGLALPDLSELELKDLEGFHWPGNIRQLKNILEQFSLYRELGLELNELLHEDLKTYQRESQKDQHLIKHLYECNNNRSLLARNLGISRGSLNYKLKKIGMT